MKKNYSIFRIFIVLILFTPFVADAQIWSENFDGSNTTNPPTFSRQCFSPKDYINVVCQDGGGCANEIEDIFIFFDGDGVTPYSGGQYLAVRDMDHQDCATNASLQETVNFSAIDISAGAGGLMYVCFDVAEGRNINGSDALGNGNDDTWDGNSNVTLRASVDGATFSTVTAIEAAGGSNTRPGIDVDCDGTANEAGEPELTNSFTKYCFELPASGNLLDLEFEFNGLNTQGEDVAIDNILVYDCEPTSGTLLSACTPFSAAIAPLFIEDFDGSNGLAPFVSACEFNQNGDGRDYHGVTCLHDGSCPNAVDMNDDYTYGGTDGNFFAARDMNGEACNGGGNSGDTPITTTAAGIDISSCPAGTSLYLCFDIAESFTPNRPSDATDTWDGNQGNPNSNSFVTFSANVDGGGDMNVISFAAIDLSPASSNNSGPAQDTNFDGKGDGAEVTDVFTTFCGEIPVTGNLLDLSFTIGGMNTDGDDVAIDNIALYCTNDIAALPTASPPAAVACVNTLPTAVCQNATVSLDGSGNAVIVAADVDGGSADAEGIQSIAIAPNTFDCSNIGDNDVTLTITDFEGETDDCMAIVTIEDNGAPTAVCANIQVDLDENGEASIVAADVNGGSSDVCGAVTLSINITEFNCESIGGNTVTLTVTDANNNASSCDATVTVNDATAALILCRPPVNADSEEGLCGAIFEILPPVVVDENCSITTVTNDAPAVYPLGTTTVTWTLTDAGNNDTQCTQTVTINDNEAPEVECGQPFHAYLAEVDPDAPPFPLDNSCQFPSYLLDPIQAVSDNCTNAGSISVSNDAPQFFPPGQYTVTYTFTDASGNVGTCEQSVKVWDISAPELTSCPNDVIVEATDTDGANATWALPTASDGCPQSAVNLTEANGYAPGDFFLVGETVVTYELTDNSGNAATCSFAVIVQPTDQMVAIAGMMATEEVATVEDVEVYINGGFNNMNVTLADGLYNFDVPMDGDYSITPQKDIDVLNGVTTFDLVLIQKHILGMQALDSPYKMIAADVNNSGQITTLDLVNLRKVILLIENDFPNNTSWRFIDQDFVFADPTNPFATAFPEFININNLATNVMDADFVSVKIGDVNGNAIANNLLSADDRTTGEPLVLNADNVKMQAGETQTINLTAADFNQFGFQFTLNFDTEKVTFENVESDLLETGNLGLTKLNDGAITLSWNEATAQKLAANTPVLSLTLTAKTDLAIAEVLSLNSRFTSAEAYHANGDLQEVTLNFGTNTASTFQLYQNVPNPFADQTTIGFALPTDDAVTISVMDLSGKVVFQTKMNGVQGFNKMELTKADLPATGVLYYQVATSNEVATAKMILLK